MIAAILLSVAIVVRIGLFGDPLYNIDDEFYLLVGDRMLHGALPYVDIWDRKPIGLFLIYALARMLPGNGVLAYQAFATVSVAATSLVVARIARRFTDAQGALGGGVLTILGDQMLGGGGGQSPIFYELPVTIAALLTLDRVRGATGPRWSGTTAMLLMGIALQIKYSALFEGALFGCALLYGKRRAGRPWPQLVADAMGYGLLGLAPTLVVAAFYAATGHFTAFWYANFVSILHRGPLPPGEDMLNLRVVLIGLAPLLPFGLTALLGRVRMPGIGFLRAWTAAAATSFAALGCYFDHYALPLVPPLAVASATLWRATSWTRLYPIALLILRIGIFTQPALETRAAGRALAGDLQTIVGPHAGECLAVFSLQVGAYLQTGACGVTPYIFPEHLLVAREQDALPVDQVAELRRVLARRPGVILAGRPPLDRLNPRAWGLLQAALGVRYVPIYRDHSGRPPPGCAPMQLYLRRDLLPG